MLKLVLKFTFLNVILDEIVIMMNSHVTSLGNLLSKTAINYVTSFGI
jgi:hypothetical protein